MTRRIASALLVDDDDAFRTMLQGALRRRGVRARTASTVEEGLVALEDEAVDLIVLDNRMARGERNGLTDAVNDGLANLARYRRKAPTSAIVMLTGYGDIPLAVAAVREGADTLLTKPIDADRLLREAEAFLERPRGAAAGTHLPPAATAYNLDEVERETIKAALHTCGGVIASAARLLGIDRRTLQRKLKRIA
jgi:two-component system response regulator RegA